MAFTGATVTLPVGQQGFSGAKNPGSMGPGNFAAMLNVDLDGGDIVKDGGATKLNSSALGDPSVVRAGISWSPAPGEQHDVVMLGNGKVLKDTGAGTFATELATGLSDNVEPPPFFFTGGGEDIGSTRKLFLCSAGHQMKYVSGTANTMQDITTPPADWASAFPTCGVLHANRLFGAGNANDPHRVYYTTASNHLVFTGAGTGSIPVYPGEGTGIAALLSFRGLLVVFKYPQGIYTIDTRSADVAQWTVQPVSRAVGAVNAQCVVPIENDVMYMDMAGQLHLLSATSDLGDVNTSNVSEQQARMSNWLRTNISLTNIRRSVGMWYGVRRKAWFVTPAAGGTANTVRQVVDFNDAKVGPRLTVSNRDTVVSLWPRAGADKVVRPASGDSLGFVWLMDQEGRNKDGAAYEMSFETANTNFGWAAPELAYKTKNFRFIEVQLDLSKNTSFVITPYIDNLPQTPIPFNIGGASVGLGTFELGTHSLGSSGIVNVRKRMEGSGRNLKLKLTHQGLNDELRMSAFHISFDVADERTREQ